MERVLVLAPNWLGDAVMAVPCVQAIRERYPAATLAVAARSHLAPLYEMVNGVDEVVPLERAGRLGGALGLVRDARRLRSGRFDRAILFPNSFRSAALAWLAGIPRRYGYATDARAPLLTEAVPRVSGGHMVEYYGRLVDALGLSPSCEVGSPKPLVEALGAPGSPSISAGSGLQPGTVAMPSARVNVPAEAREWARLTLTSRGWQPGDALVGMAPGAAYGGAKQWPPERFAEVARRLTGCRPRLKPGTYEPGTYEPGTYDDAGPDVAVGKQDVGSGLQAGTTCTVLVGSGGDRAACDEVARVGGDAVINLVAQTDLRQLAAIIAECRVFISNDSGAMHLAAAVGVPVVAIFGSTNEKETAPLPAASAEATGPGLKPGAYDKGDTVGDIVGPALKPGACDKGDTVADIVGPELQLGALPAPGHVILTADVGCRPCMLRECPIEGHPCMTTIPAARVVDAVKGLLAFGLRPLGR